VARAGQRAERARAPDGGPPGAGRRAGHHRPAAGIGLDPHLGLRAAEPRVGGERLRQHPRARRPARPGEGGARPLAVRLAHRRGDAGALELRPEHVGERLRLARPRLERAHRLARRRQPALRLAADVLHLARDLRALGGREQVRQHPLGDRRERRDVGPQPVRQALEQVAHERGAVGDEPLEHERRVAVDRGLQRRARRGVPRRRRLRREQPARCGAAAGARRPRRHGIHRLGVPRRDRAARREHPHRRRAGERPAQLERSRAEQRLERRGHSGVDRARGRGPLGHATVSTRTPLPRTG
jgi:hypothetical protein